MDSLEALRVSDATVVARYLQLRSHFHDRLLNLVGNHLEERYQVQPTRRLPATLVALVRGGYSRPEEGEMWPVVFLSSVDITLALAMQITPERLAGLGTVLHGPQRLRHRQWEDWWGWEISLAALHPSFFEQPPSRQDEIMTAWFAERLEWLAHNGLLKRK